MKTDNAPVAPHTYTVPPRSLVSSRELEVIRLLVEGNSNRVIADVLFISERTVGNHLTHIYSRLGLASRTALAAWAIRNKLA